MSIKPEFNIDLISLSSYLNIYVSGNLVTTYTFSNNEVQLAELEEEAVLSLEEYILNVKHITEWVSLIKKYISPLNETKNVFEEELKKTEEQIVAKFDSSGNQVTRAVYESDPKEISFEPRSSLTMKFVNFDHWKDFLKRISTNAKNF